MDDLSVGKDDGLEEGIDDGDVGQAGNITG